MRFPEQRRAKREEPNPENLFLGVAGSVYKIVDFQQNVLGKTVTQGDSPVCEKKKQSD